MGTLRRTCRLSQRRGPLPKLLWANMLLLLLRTINHMLRILAIISKWNAEPTNEMSWNCALLQLNVKKRLVYGGIVLIWILLPAHEIIVSYLGTDIINGTCVPMGVINSYISWNILIISYVLPLIAMLFCYARIVHKLRRKVTPNSISYMKENIVRFSMRTLGPWPTVHHQHHHHYHIQELSLVRFNCYMKNHTWVA